MNSYINLNKKNGFTLVEVLVVIAIIGILSAVLYASFQQAREQSRNTAMQAAIKETQLSLETYKAQYGSYPPIDQSVGSSVGSDSCHSLSGGVRTVSSDCFGADYITGQGSLPSLTPDFINELPLGDISGNPGCDVVYITEDSNAPNFYKLAAVECVEGVDATSGVQDDDEMAYCPESCGTCPYAQSAPEFYESYAVYSNGGQCI